MSNIVERRNKILELLAQNGSVKSNELVDILDTSRETVRRDLNALEEKNLLTKTYGGAVAPQKNTWEFVPLQEREKINLAEKKAICKHAAKSVSEFDTIFLDNSTTVMQITNYIPKNYNITFIVHSVRLLTQLANINNPKWNVINLGGTLNYETFSTYRYLTISNLKHFKPNKAFMSCHGIDSDLYVTETRVDDVEIKEYIVNNCKETYLLVDNSKLPKQGVVKVSDIAEYDTIITDNKANGMFISRLNSHDCKIDIVPIENE